MKKTFHFLAGLPRSGNTLLSALLNQNPYIYSTPLSPLPSLMWEFENTCNQLPPFKRNTENRIRAEIFLSLFIQNYYKEVQKPFIIDREKAWGTPANLDIIKRYITPTPKIIFTVRDILEIIASFIKMDADFLKRDAYNSEYWMSNYRFEKDLLVEHLMRIQGEIDNALLSLASAFYPENKGVFHIVEYNNLVFHPEKTMAGIYDFLDMPNYEHNFNQIQKLETDNEADIGLPKDLHKIRESLSQSATSVDILSDYIRHKYSNMEFWREGATMKIRGRDF